MIIKNEIKKCLLCYDAPCSKVCGYDVERIIRASYFENDIYAANLTSKINCENCDGRCEKACFNEVRIKDIIKNLKTNNNEVNYNDVDLSTSICGIKLKNPFLLSSSVVASSYEMVASAFEAGFAGAVYKTVSLLDIRESSPRFEALYDNSNNVYGFKNIEQLSDVSLSENLEIFKKLKKNYPDHVLVVSIMGKDENEWELISKKVSESGADLIELNFSCPNMESKNLGSNIGQHSDVCKKYVAAAKRGATVPVLAKLTPNITDMREIAEACIDAGADGIAAINTIKSVGGLYLEDGKIRNTMIGGYSGKAVKPIALRFITELAKDEKIKRTSISGIGGIETWSDAVEFLMLGSDSVQITTAVMLYGQRIIDDLIRGLKIFMASNGYKNINEFKGIALKNLVDNDKMDRKTIIYPKLIEDKCLGCLRCYVSCKDGGHQAISFDPATRKVSFNLAKCVGCSLCYIVCPFNAIEASKRVLNPRYINK